MRRLPARTCVMCDRTIEDIGGVRIYWTASKAVLVSHRPRVQIVP